MTGVVWSIAIVQGAVGVAPRLHLARVAGEEVAIVAIVLRL